MGHEPNELNEPISMFSPREKPNFKIGKNLEIGSFASYGS
jgi:hypothetical protein